MHSREEKLFTFAWNDGARVGRKGLGITKSGKYDYPRLRRMFERSIQRFRTDGIDLNSVFVNGFMGGWHTGREKQAPIGGDALTTGIY